MPELITVCWANGKPYQAIYAVQGEMEIFNPSEPRVYSTMHALLEEVKGKFPSNYIHLGMSEDECQEESSDLPVFFCHIYQAWMKSTTSAGESLDY